jgi:hypothetical protein
MNGPMDLDRLKNLTYIAIILSGVLLASGILLARNQKGKNRAAAVIASLVVMEVGLGGLECDYSGRLGEFFFWAGGVIFGIMLGLFIARFVWRRIESGSLT